jgi:aryl-alcohol dehydrogenase-like predicted oxidoreductase
MLADCLEPRPLGSSGMQVSALSLGSWRTYERLPAATGIEIMRAARDQGITFFDDARYNDETGSAPIPTGQSEVVFGTLFRAAGIRRDEVIIANKLWWEFWPRQNAVAELSESLERMGLDYIDLIYAGPPAEGMSVAEAVAEVGALISAGTAGGCERVVRRDERWAGQGQLRRRRPAAPAEPARTCRAEADRSWCRGRLAGASTPCGAYQRSPPVST